MSEKVEAYSTKRVTLSVEERNGKEGCRVEYQDGYVSWAPADVIMRDYRTVTGGFMTFGQALESLKLGKKVRREKWKHFVARSPYVMMIDDVAFRVELDAGAQSPVVTPYKPSNSEMFANDWEEVS